MYRITCSFIYVYFRLFHRIKFYGKENIPEEGALILVSNHASYYDPPIVFAGAYPRFVNFMAKAELYNNPIVRFVLINFKTFPITKDKINKKALVWALGLLKQGEVIGIFPEGTRVKNKQLEQVFHGAAFLALKTNTPVLPVAVIGSERVMPEGARFPKPVRLSLRFGKPFMVKSKEKRDLEAASNKIMEEIERVKNKN